MTTRRFYLYAAVVVLLAFLLREAFVLIAENWDGANGDSGEYLAYALHWIQHGTFSLHTNVPDAYRTPGYPALIALAMQNMDGWYPRLLQWQAVLSTATVAFVIILARQWTTRGWALVAGVLMAFQPHSIVASGEVLSETLFGFALVGALLLASLALNRRTLGWSVAAGAAFGLAYLVNPLVALLPVALLLPFWRAGLLRNGAVLLAVSLLSVGGWGIRSAVIHGDGSQRAYVNLVQGSHPEYHLAWVSRNEDPEPARIVAAIDAEARAAGKSHSLATVRERLAADPIGYARWYASKVYLLWDWDVRIGYGGPYVHEIMRSPLDRNPLLRATTATSKALNPLLFVLALGFALAAWRSPVALAFLYLTAVHVVLQAEPRYATPYRGIEMVLAVCALAWLVAYARALIPKAKHLTAGTQYPQP